MKKVIIATCLFGLFTFNNAQAQNLLGKLKDKVGQSGASGFGGGDKDWNGFALPSDKEGEKDLANTKLEGTSFKKDKWGVSGVYVCQKAIGLSNDLSRGISRTIQKFAVQVSDNGEEIMFTHTGDEKPFIYKNRHNDEALLKGLKAKGMFYLLGNYADQQFREAVFTDSIEKDGKASKNAEALKNITLLEPGVFVFHPNVEPKNGVTTCAGGSAFTEGDEYMKYNPFNLVYLKGKDVSRWTNESIKKELLRQSDVNCGLRLGGYAANAEMPARISGFKDEPANAALLKAAQGRAKQFGWKETITSVYPIAEWRNEYKLLGINELNTLVSRVMEINVIMKTPSGECAIETMGIRQDNVFTTGSTNENFTGKPLYGDYNGQITPIDCSKTKL